MIASTRHHVSAYHGRRQLGRISAYKIKDATDGELTLDALLVPGEAA